MVNTAPLRTLPIIVVAYSVGFAWLGLRPGPAALTDSPNLATRALIAFLLPTAAVGLLWLFNTIGARQSASDRELAEAESTATERILLRVVIFIAALHGLIVLRLSDMPWMRTSAPRMAFVLFGLVLVSVGNLLPTTRPNLLVGIRTPRSLASRALWMAINRVGGYVAVGLGLVMIASALLFHHLLAGQLILVAFLAAVAIVIGRYRTLVRDERSPMPEEVVRGAGNVKRPRRRRARLLLKILGGMTLVLIAAGIIYEKRGERQDSTRFARIGRSVDIGGRSLNIHCLGLGASSWMRRTKISINGSHESVWGGRTGCLLPSERS